MKAVPFLFCYLIAVLLLGSWVALPGFWNTLDDATFLFFNHLLTSSHPLYVKILAFTNARFFDRIIFVFLFILMLVAMQRDTHPRPVLRWITIGILMSLCSTIGGYTIHDVLTYTRPSPAYLHHHVHLISTFTDYSVKDAVSNSFPGDHGVHAMIFAAFMLRFSDRTTAIISVISTLLVTCPRIMVGAHAFTDIYIGSLSLVLFLTPWFLFTPLYHLAERTLETCIRLPARK